MTLDTIAYFIIFTAVGALIRNIFRFFNPVVKKQANTLKCGGCTSGCEIKGIHELNRNKLTHRDQYKFYL